VVRRVPAAEIETVVVNQLRGLLRAAEIILATWRAARVQDGGTTEAEVREALLNLHRAGRTVPRRAGAHSPACGRARRRSPRRA
jgi:hypothetical protein